MTGKKLSVSGLFAAIIFVLTMFIKIPAATGYVHLGDAAVYLSALIIGPWALLAGAIGEGLADVAGSYVMYLPATVIVKILLALPFVIFGSKEKYFSKKNCLLTITAGLVNVGGYFIYDLIINKAYAVVNVPGNIIQSVGSAVIFIVFAVALDKAEINKRIKL